MTFSGYHGSRNRRKGPDFWSVVFRVFGISGWLLLLAALAVFEKAKPETPTFIDERIFIGLGVPLALRTTWDMDLARYIFLLMVMGFSLSIFGYIIQLKRRRREDDGYGIYLIILGLISFAGMVVYWYRFLVV